jgi:hypothetical protein
MWTFSELILTSCRLVPSWRSYLLKLRLLRPDRTDLDQTASSSCAGIRESTYIEKAIASLNDVVTTYRRLSEVTVAKVLKGSFSEIQPPNEVKR